MSGAMLRAPSPTRGGSPNRERGRSPTRERRPHRKDDANFLGFMKAVFDPRGESCFGGPVPFFCLAPAPAKEEIRPASSRRRAHVHEGFAAIDTKKQPVETPTSSPTNVMEAISPPARA